MTVAVVMAWEDMGCPYRRRAYEWVREWYRRELPDAPVVVSASVPFSRAASINLAIQEAYDADIIVQADPDSFVRIEALKDAIALAEESPGLVNPHNGFRYLNELPTFAFLQGDLDADDLERSDPDAICHDHGVGGTGNLAVFSRETWEQAGGFDERFGVWAGDDGAFAFAAGMLVGPRRRTGDVVWHLYHPRHPDSVVGSPGYMREFAILAEYRDAHSVPAMRKVIARNPRNR